MFLGILIANVNQSSSETIYLIYFTAYSAHCYSKCLNGGKCAGPNICKCPEDFVGSHCQHSKDNCSPKKVGFNGSFECVGTKDELSCSLKCPAGVEFEFPPEPIYKCKFETGVFTPSKVPKCVYGKGRKLFRTFNR